jgi:HAMP domain-containing protein
MLVLILPIILVPLVTLGLFGYSQAIRLGGEPTISLLLTGAVMLFASIVAVALALQLVRSVLTPVEELEEVMASVAGGDMAVRARPYTSDELADLGLHFNVMADELAEQEQVKIAFSQYVSPAVRDGILSGDIALGGERRELTIAFTDIRGFTTWCERTPPENVIQTLNAYYENLVQTLIKYGGTVTRYTGDGVLVLFGAPLEDPDHARHAVAAALEAQCWRASTPSAAGWGPSSCGPDSASTPAWRWWAASAPRPGPSTRPSAILPTSPAGSRGSIGVWGRRS